MFHQYQYYCKSACIYNFPKSGKFRNQNELNRNQHRNIYLFNTLGRLLISTEISGQNNLNIQNIASGLYSFRLICKDGSVVTGKIIIQH
ncbi:MAG: T9SS type A sorting domain-containing protein [Bacteroidetes bacterium]|nr:T9SS type A sorting domain-containing protein [Bacteroidota bacterium]